MTHRDRFHATIERRPVDRPACWLGLPTPEAHQGLLAHFGVDSIATLRLKLGDDVYPVELPYHSPVTDAIYAAFPFAKEDCGRTLTAPGFFEDFSDPSRVDVFDWPDPCRYIDPEACREVVDAAPPDCAVLGVVWSAHFQDACAAFGMETALVKMVVEPEMFRAVIDRITEFYLQANDIFLRATRGKLDAILIGNDFGHQTGLMLSPDLIRKHVWPGARRLIEQANSYGVKVIYHSCGSIIDIVPDLIDLGVDAIHPIQALAQDMSAANLKAAFGQRVSFCGGVDTQELLVTGTPEDVRSLVHELRALFPTGLILSPSHEALLPDVSPANVEALFAAATEAI